ncbi:hypothetical protein MNBD_GAMMA16-199, partial [hydrothermal vent metagenome]
GKVVDEISTLRPYDDPGAALFYYRLLRYQSSIVVKNHTVYEFSDQRMQRYRELFLATDYEVNQLLYMDFLRMEGEDYSLAFLPASKRKAIRDAWYVGQRSTIDELFSAPQAWLSTEAVTGFQTDDPQQELYQKIKTRLTPVAQQAETMNQCGCLRCKEKIAKAARIKADVAMDKIAQLQGKNLDTFPDVAFVRIKMDDQEEDFAYTLIRNKAYKNVTSFLAFAPVPEGTCSGSDTIFPATIFESIFCTLYSRLTDFS